MTVREVIKALEKLPQHMPIHVEYADSPMPPCLNEVTLVAAVPARQYEPRGGTGLDKRAIIEIQKKKGSKKVRSVCVILGEI